MHLFITHIHHHKHFKMNEQELEALAIVCDWQDLLYDYSAE